MSYEVEPILDEAPMCNYKPETTTGSATDSGPFLIARTYIEQAKAIKPAQFTTHPGYHYKKGAERQTSSIQPARGDSNYSRLTIDSRPDNSTLAKKEEVDWEYYRVVEQRYVTESD